MNKFNSMIGIDPSFSGLGISSINLEKQLVTLDELSVSTNDRNFY